jgi:hypothetical protein
MKKNMYLILSIIGAILPFSQFVAFTNQHGFNLNIMFANIFANKMATGIALDAMWAAIILIIFILSENKKINIKHLWLPIIGIFMIGLSFAFPFYLYLREIALHKQKKDASVDASV